MNGINVLNAVISDGYNSNWFGGFIFGIISFIALVILVFQLVYRNKLDFPIFTPISTSMVLSFCIFLTVYGACQPPLPKITSYQITIDKNVKLADIQHKYNIEKIEGQIYTVTEKIKDK